jgi:hypothetical protein
MNDQEWVNGHLRVRNYTFPHVRFSSFKGSLYLHPDTFAKCRNIMLSVAGHYTRSNKRKTRARKQRAFFTASVLTGGHRNATFFVLTRSHPLRYDQVLGRGPDQATSSVYHHHHARSGSQVKVQLRVVGDFSSLRMIRKHTPSRSRSRPRHQLR